MLLTAVKDQQGHKEYNKTHKSVCS